jgi:hypothetical protein
MSDAAIFATVFVSIFVLRIVAATLVFYWILPQSDRCPHCNAVTLRVQSRGLASGCVGFDRPGASSAAGAECCVLDR